ncbi:hypothetical protein ACWIG5_24025 [Streptomyces lydicus]
MQRPISEAMTNTPSVPERLLALGADFTRHNDALNQIHLLRRPHLAEALAGRISSAQALARRARELTEEVLTTRSLNKSLGVRASMARIVRLAEVADRTAGHLGDAEDALHAPNTDASYASPARSEADLLEAGRRAAFAGRLTSLGAGDCLTAATVLAVTLHLQHPSSHRRVTALSDTQRAMLESVAGGRVALNQPLGEVCTQHSGPRATIAAVRSLEARGLLYGELDLVSHNERFHLTADGVRALAAALGLHRATTSAAARPVMRPSATTTRSTAR